MTAESQLSVICGHFWKPWLSATNAMAQTFEASEIRVASSGP